MEKKISRLAKLSGLTSRVSSSYLKQRIKGVFQSEEENTEAVKNLNVENADRIVEAMGILKGAAMKVGQSVALLADSMDLPEEISQKFSRLHDQAEPVPFHIIEEVLAEEYQGKQHEIFSRIDPEPLGTASLAQAHAAWLADGRSVVIKILHRGVEISVDTDLAALKTILITGRFLRRSREEIDTIFDEIKLRLREELDYQNEAENLLRFHQFFKDRDDVVIPYPLVDLSTKKVLVMERIMGDNLDGFIVSASPEIRHKAGDTLVSLFHEMVYVFRALHADPHGGNFLFREDGSIGLLDFGCVKRLEPVFLDSYAKLGNAIVDEDNDALFQLCEEMGILKDATDEAKESFLGLVEVLREPFQSAMYHSGSQQDQLMEKIKKVSPTVLRHPSVRSPRDLIFLHRSLIGIYSMLCRLEHKGPYEQIRRSYADFAIEVSKGLKEDRGWR